LFQPLWNARSTKMQRMTMARLRQDEVILRVKPGLKQKYSFSRWQKFCNSCKTF